MYNSKLEQIQLLINLRENLSLRNIQQNKSVMLQTLCAQTIDKAFILSVKQYAVLQTLFVNFSVVNYFCQPCILQLIQSVQFTLANKGLNEVHLQNFSLILHLNKPALCAHRLFQLLPAMLFFALLYDSIAFKYSLLS